MTSPMVQFSRVCYYLAEFQTFSFLETDFDEPMSNKAKIDAYPHKTSEERLRRIRRSLKSSFLQKRKKEEKYTDRSSIRSSTSLVPSESTSRSRGSRESLRYSQFSIRPVESEQSKE